MCLCPVSGNRGEKVCRGFDGGGSGRLTLPVFKRKKRAHTRAPDEHTGNRLNRLTRLPGALFDTSVIPGEIEDEFDMNVGRYCVCVLPFDAFVW